MDGVGDDGDGDMRSVWWAKEGANEGERGRLLLKKYVERYIFNTDNLGTFKLQ
jgi:hypothetical protein